MEALFERRIEETNPGKEEMVWSQGKYKKPEEELIFKKYDKMKQIDVTERDYHAQCLEENKQNLKHPGKF